MAVRLVPVKPGWRMDLADQVANMIHVFASRNAPPVSEGPATWDAASGPVAIQILALVQRALDDHTEGT